MRLKDSDTIRYIIGSETRRARIKHLNMTLKELSNKTGINLKTLSGFEHGRSSNFYIFYVYYSLLNDDSKIEVLKRILERVE